MTDKHKNFFLQKYGCIWAHLKSEPTKISTNKIGND